MKKSFLSLLFLISVFVLSVNIINVKADGGYVTAIKVDGKDLEGFTSSNTGPYDLGKVDSSKGSITLGYVLDTGYSFGQCSVGEIALKYGKNELKCEVGKEGEETKTYQINVERPDNRSGDNSLTSLMVGNNKVVLSDTNEYTVSVDSKTQSVEIFSTKLANTFGVSKDDKDLMAVLEEISGYDTLAGREIRKVVSIEKAPTDYRGFFICNNGAQKKHVKRNIVSKE